MLARDGQDGGGDYFRGTGWYRRRFAARSAWAGREVYLQFDGANRRADVYLNGHLLGTHLGGFARFRFDATPYVKAGADNVLAVRVNNEVNDIAPTVATLCVTSVVVAPMRAAAAAASQPAWPPPTTITS